MRSTIFTVQSLIQETIKRIWTSLKSQVAHEISPLYKRSSLTCKFILVVFKEEIILLFLQRFCKEVYLYITKEVRAIS